MASDSKEHLDSTVHQLAAMDSEQLLRKMSQKSPKPVPDLGDAANGRRVSRKRTKTARALESEELEAEFLREQQAQRKMSRTGAAPDLMHPIPHGAAPAAPSAEPKAGPSSVPDLFKPAEPAPPAAAAAEPEPPAGEAAAAPAPPTPTPAPAPAAEAPAQQKPEADAVVTAAQNLTAPAIPPAVPAELPDGVPAIPVPTDEAAQQMDIAVPGEGEGMEAAAPPPAGEEGAPKASEVCYWNCHRGDERKWASCASLLTIGERVVVVPHDCIYVLPLNRNCTVKELRMVHTQRNSAACQHGD
jgi:hypothetical protein